MDQQPEQIVLTVERLNVHRQLCPAGMVIAPNVEGWPSPRVRLAVLHGYAMQMNVLPAEQPQAAQAESVLSRREKKKKKHEGPHGL